MATCFSTEGASRPSPLFEFFVYRIYQRRGEDKFYLRSFRVIHTGHLLAKEAIRGTEESEEISKLFSSSKADVYYLCSKTDYKRCDSEKKGSVTYMGEVSISETAQQWFKSNRQISGKRTY